MACMFTRTLGRAGIEVSALGLGCWAIGGPWRFNGREAGWGQVDDEESVRAIRRALDLGVTLFDTADAYGAGHSERVLGRALGDRRDEVVISTKVGLVFDEATREGGGEDLSAAHIRRACDASLRRLGTDRIDVYLLHGGVSAPEAVPPVLDVLEELVAAGKIRFYGSSIDDPAICRAVDEGPHAVAIQHELNVLTGNLEALALAEELGFASFVRGPLAMGLLTGSTRRRRGRRRTTCGATRRTGTTSTTARWRAGSRGWSRCGPSWRPTGARSWRARLAGCGGAAR
jgi:aryl-alcohol dehydrogenase-like predicted oxidoreductase